MKIDDKLYRTLLEVLNIENCKAREVKILCL